MDLLLVALLVLAVAAVVVVALGRVGGGMAAVGDPLPPPLEEPVQRAGDLDRARFRLALRGYRMDQVDTVLDEARDLLAAQEEEIDRLRALAPVHPAASATSATESAAVGPVGHPGSTDLGPGGPVTDPSGRTDEGPRP